MTKIQIIPWAYGIGDLIRLDPLIRGIKEKYDDARISIYMLKNLDALKYHPDVAEMFSIWCSRCDYIYNCNEQGHGVLDQVVEDAGKYKQLIGYGATNTETNLETIQEFREYVSWGKGFDYVYDLRRHNTLNLSQWLCKICNVEPIDPKIYFYFSQESDTFAKEFINKNCSKPVVVVHTHSEGKILGNKHTRNDGSIVDLGKPGIKNWGKEKFIELINRLKKDFDCILLGTKKDEIELSFIQEKTECIVVKDKSFNQAMALIKHAKYFVGVDSAPAHIAMCCDVPALILYCDIFSYTCHPVLPKVKHRFLSTDPHSVERISVDMVYESFLKLIEENH